MTANIFGRLHRFLGAMREELLVLRLRLPRIPLGYKRDTIPLIVAMTTFPERIEHSWVAIETILRQSVVPRKLLLVLSLEEFPNQIIPARIKKQSKRGLSILWVEKNFRSYDKLIPVLSHYPDHPVITVDDDKFFPPKMVERLWDAHLRTPRAIIGYRGWRIREPAESPISYGKNWERLTSFDSGTDLFLPGGNGVLYPPFSLEKGVLDAETAITVCPHADDIWFWGHALKNGSTFVCLGMSPHRPVARQGTTSALSNTNVVKNAEQFQKVLEYLDIAEILVSAIRKSDHDR